VCVCVCVCPPSLRECVYSAFVYRCSVCVAVNIGQELDLRGSGTSPSPTDSQPGRGGGGGQSKRPAVARRRQRSDLSTLARESLSPPPPTLAWHAACLLRINGVLPPAYHPFHWLIMGTRGRWIAEGGGGSEIHGRCSLHRGGAGDPDRCRW